jgi:hypothetical protein
MIFCTTITIAVGVVQSAVCFKSKEHVTARTVQLFNPPIHIQNNFANMKLHSHPTSLHLFPLLGSQPDTALPHHFPSRYFVSNAPLSEGQAGATWEP